MSDREPEEDGWWQGSDGKWYPPNSAGPKGVTPRAESSVQRSIRPQPSGKVKGWVQAPDGSWQQKQDTARGCANQGCMAIIAFVLLAFVLLVIVLALGSHGSSVR